jgi:hypothetical protein
MPLNMKLSFAYSNVAAVEGAWPVMGFASHQQVHGEPSDRIACCWVLPLPSLASIMVIVPHHAAVTHVGCSSEVGQREHMVRQGFTGKCWSEFLCLGGYLALPARQVGGCPAGCARSTPLRRATPAGGPVAGAVITKQV